jgi:hypothetical protein
VMATVSQELGLQGQRESAQVDRSAINLRKFAPLAGQLALLLVVFWGFNIENEAFLRLATACFAGFAIHYFLPFRLKKQGLIVISILGALIALLQFDPRMPTYADADSAMMIAITTLSCVLLPLVTVVAVLGQAILSYALLQMRVPFIVRLLPLLSVVATLMFESRITSATCPTSFRERLVRSGRTVLFRPLHIAYMCRFSQKLQC